MTNKLYGLNIAVKDLEQAVLRFEALFGTKARRGGSEFFAFPGLAGANFDLDGIMINLVSPLDLNDEKNSVAKFLRSHGEGVLLISLKSDNLEDDTLALAAKGINCISPKLFSGRFGKVNFVHPTAMHGVQIELFEPSPEMQARRA
jgi:methylmalonyl-CoA/ethylmalonyl-CoA epimerase